MKTPTVNLCYGTPDSWPYRWISLGWSYYNPISGVTTIHIYNTLYRCRFQWLKDVFFRPWNQPSMTWRKMKRNKDIPGDSSDPFDSLVVMSFNLPKGKRSHRRTLRFSPSDGWIHHYPTIEHIMKNISRCRNKQNQVKFKHLEAIH